MKSAEAYSPGFRGHRRTAKPQLRHTQFGAVREYAPIAAERSLLPETSGSRGIGPLQANSAESSNQRCALCRVFLLAFRSAPTDYGGAFNGRAAPAVVRGLSGRGAQTEIHLLRLLELADGAFIAPIVKLQVEVAQAIETIAMRLSLVS